jgi:hypothetical protein
MTFKSNFDYTDPIFQDLKILKIHDYLTLLFMYRYHKTEHLSIIFNTLFVNNSDIHHYKTRNASIFTKSIEEQIMSIILLLVQVLIFGMSLTLI